MFKYLPHRKKGCALCNLYKTTIIIVAVILILNLIVMNTSVYFRKTIQLPFSLHLNKQDIILAKGEEAKLFVYGINKRVSYSSTNFRVAGVNFNGRVHAYQTGKTFILAKVDGKILKCRVRVIDINKDRLSLYVGDDYRLRIKGIFSIPEWKSSNKKVATVSMFGYVKAKEKGTTIISAKVKGKTIKCIVKVK
ncbi:Ig-like domain-containing protein [Mobilitalea sibirica]|uniref:Ig-like domain-containing protein n=1 Tax=Mobilitalea sibirica TaxID=1462919 RepID=A0A8J7HE13_9FIRM|nr:Ig-like domain-containing protein [Mobilitalea sibirica]MBH1941479.1 Ig-like domain-containing protein [Mobilitalea sibirica]